MTILNLTYAEVQHLLKVLRWWAESADYGEFSARNKELIAKLEHREDEYR